MMTFDNVSSQPNLFLSLLSRISVKGFVCPSVRVHPSAFVNHWRERNLCLGCALPDLFHNSTTDINAQHQFLFFFFGLTSVAFCNV